MTWRGARQRQTPVFLGSSNSKGRSRGTKRPEIPIQHELFQEVIKETSASMNVA